MFEFMDTARAFGDSCLLVKLFGFSFLDGTPLFEIVVILVSCIAVHIDQGFHRDDRPSATKIVLLPDGDAGLFHNAADGSTARFVTFSVAATQTWGAYEGGCHGEAVIGGKIFVGVEFGRKGLEISVQSITAFLEFAYVKGSGLEGMSEGIGLHDEMYSGVRRQGIVGGNLLLNGSSKSMSELTS